MNATVARENRNGTMLFISVQLKKLKIPPILFKEILAHISVVGVMVVVGGIYSPEAITLFIRLNIINNYVVLLISSTVPLMALAMTKAPRRRAAPIMV